MNSTGYKTLQPCPLEWQLLLHLDHYHHIRYRLTFLSFVDSGYNTIGKYTFVKFNSSNHIISNIVLNKIELATCFAPRKYEIKEAIAELRRDKELPLKNGGHKPNYEKIKNVYAVNAAKLLKLEAEKKKRNKISLANDEHATILILTY